MPIRTSPFSGMPKRNTPGSPQGNSTSTDDENRSSAPRPEKNFQTSCSFRFPFSLNGRKAGTTDELQGDGDSDFGGGKLSGERKNDCLSGPRRRQQAHRKRPTHGPEDVPAGRR